MSRLSAICLTLLTLALSGCGYNAMQAADEEIKANWSEVLNQYQRRADLIPNLVATVKRFAQQEEKIFTEIADARSRIGSVQATPELVNDEAALQKFQQAQAGMSGALSKLLAISEAYPELKSDQNFRDLQAQLEGTENRVTVARNRYIEAVKTYNTMLRQFPQNLTAKLFGYKPKANFSVENEREISTPPTVDFGT